MDALTSSISQDGFWGGVVCRQTPTGVEIAAGHTRVRAAMKAGIKTADLFVDPDMDDDRMIRIYTRENATQRGNTTTAMAGAVVSAVGFLTKGILANTISQYVRERSKKAIDVIKGNLLSGDGIGEELIAEFLEGIPRISRAQIREQLANLKRSGDYQQAVIDAVKTIDSDQARQLVAKLSGYEPEVDFAGVAPHLKNARQMTAFREKVIEPGIKEILPVSKQAELAKHLVEKAKRDKAELTADYVRSNIGILARDTKDEKRKLSRQEQAERERRDVYAKFDRLCEDFARHARGLMDIGLELIRFVDEHTQKYGGFRMPQTMKDAIRYATQVLNRLTRAL